MKTTKKWSKVFLVGMTAMALAFGLVVVGCDNGNGGDDVDTWSNITSLSQLDGTWKGSYSETKTVQEYVEESGDTWDVAMAAMFGDMKVTASAEITQTFIASAETLSGTIKETITFSGGNINLVWPLLNTMFSDPEGVTVTVDDANHSIIMTQDNPPSHISLEDMNGAQINQYETKVKIPADTIGEGSPEIILEKQ